MRLMGIGGLTGATIVALGAPPGLEIHKEGSS